VGDPVLVTGAAGFAGSHLLGLLASSPEPVYALRRPSTAAAGDAAQGRVTWVEVDLLDPRATMTAIDAIRPREVYHCAGAAHVGDAWANRAPTLAANVLATHHLLEAVRRTGVSCRVLIPGSAAVYRSSNAPLDEDAPLEPSGPYALSKLAQEMLGARAMLDAGIEAVLVRAFNHVGPRQAPSFAASGFAQQIARIEAGLAPAVLRVGNLESRRDITDVRDTVRAYARLMRHAAPGRPYNVCSGAGYSARELLDRLLAISGVAARIEPDPSRMRPSDTPVLIGDNRRIRDETGWRPEIGLDDSLRDLLAWWRATVRGTVP
jgi:GDP-4-dehydro-6-deoxy-D-mannose reductase